MDDTDPYSLAIAGRLVKDTLLRSEQKRDTSDDLVPDDTVVETSPSSFFVLTLADHKLLFYREQSNSPKLTEFEASVTNALICERNNLVNSEYEQRRTNNQPCTKKSIKNQIPIPDVSVTPIGNDDTVEEFISKFSKINLLSLKILVPNGKLSHFLGCWG